MSATDPLEIPKLIATILAGVGAPSAAVFAFLNWRRATLESFPRAFLQRPEPRSDGLVETNLVIENRSIVDIRVDSIQLTCGRFAGVAIRDSTGGVTGYTPGTDKTINSPILVASKDSRTIHIRFLADNPQSTIAAQLIRKGSGHIVYLSVSE